MNLPKTYVKRIEGEHHQRHRSIYNPSHTRHNPSHVYGTMCLVYIIHIIQSSPYPTYISMHVIPSHTNTQGRGRGMHTPHTNTQHNTHNATSEAEAPPRHRHTRHHQRQQIGKHNTTRHPTEGQGQLKNFQERPWTVNLTHFLGFPKGGRKFYFF